MIKIIHLCFWMSDFSPESEGGIGVQLIWWERMSHSWDPVYYLAHFSCVNADSYLPFLPGTVGQWCLSWGCSHSICSVCKTLCVAESHSFLYLALQWSVDLWAVPSPLQSLHSYPPSHVNHPSWATSLIILADVEKNRPLCCSVLD